MKIAVVTSRTLTIRWFRLEMIAKFQNLGHEVIVIGDEAASEWRDYFNHLNIHYIEYPVNRTGTNPWEDYRSYQALREILKKEAPDKVFSYLSKANIYGGLACKYLKESEHYPLVGGLGSIIRGKGLKNSILRTYMLTAYKFAFKQSNKVFIQNLDDVNYLIQKSIIKTEQVVRINGSGVNTNDFPYTEPPNEARFLFVGRLIKDKGIVEYIEAAKLVLMDFPEVEFHLVGALDANPSSLTENELRAVMDEGILTYHGEMDSVYPVLANCSIFVLPSYYEGTPKSVLEAMSVGRMIITTDAPGCRETVNNGDNGYLVPVRNSQALAQSMIKAIKSPKMRKDMGKASRAIVEEKFDVNIVNNTIARAMKL